MRRGVTLSLMLPALLAPALAQGAADPHPPLFEAAMGAKGPLASDDQNTWLLPCSGPPSIDVDAAGKWWVLDAIGSRVVVFEHDGSAPRTITIPVKAGLAPPYRADLALDGSGGFFLLNTTGKRVEHYDSDGKGLGSFGAEKVPKSKDRSYALLDLPERLGLIDGDLLVEDGGSENLIRFGFDGTFRAAMPGVSVAAPVGAGYIAVSRQANNVWLESAPGGGHSRPLVKIEVKGKTLREAVPLGATKAGDLVVAAVLGADSDDEVRILRYDHTGKPLDESILPVPSDDYSPARRWRLTPSGTVAWFQVKDGRFQAFESRLSP